METLRSNPVLGEDAGTITSFDCAGLLTEHTYDSRLCRSPDRAQVLAEGFIFLVWNNGDLTVTSRPRRGRRDDHDDGQIPSSAETPVRSLGSIVQVS